MPALRTLRTVRHLRLSQILWRMRYRRMRAREARAGYDLAGRLRAATTGLERDSSYTAPKPLPGAGARWREGRLTLLNDERPFAGGADWHPPATSGRLRQAHLHGHRWIEHLAGEGGEASAAARGFLADWVASCPPGVRGFADFGWNSYNIATRILAWSVLPAAWLDPSLTSSLAAQAEYLAGHIEWDLRANHLLRDAAGLARAGRIFRGPAADRWFAAATELAREQIEEQVLPDGGHFERSPMYHLHVMEDLTALACDLRDPDTLAKLASAWGRMAEWAAWMRHPDGQVPLFNDGAFNGAPPPSAFLAAPPATSPEPRYGLRHFSDTGIIAFHGRPWTVFFDVGPVGPDYQPGHAHADSLALEASFDGERLFVDPGTFSYDDDARRRYDRSTAAHNTVCVDGLDSSEVWHIFRVGRRARPSGVEAAVAAGGFRAKGTHDGYAWLAGSPVHAREVSVDGIRLGITDTVRGSGAHALSGGWLLAPGWTAEEAPGGWRVAKGSRTLSVTVSGPAGLRRSLERRPCHPEYGLEIETLRLGWSLDATTLPVEVRTAVE
ncbi:MAG: alginate lyase family protein [Planctomycetia bacterium]|nr:alginate lyase family protein [Planctomycetia bacterium]